MGADGETKNKRGRERETEAMRMTLSNRDVLQKGHFLRTTAFENLKSMCNFNILGQKISLTVIFKNQLRSYSWNT